MSVRLRSFTVPRGSRFVVMIPGDGPLVAEEGSQVTIRVDESWERVIEATRDLFEFPNREDKPDGGSHG